MKIQKHLRQKAIKCMAAILAADTIIAVFFHPVTAFAISGPSDKTAPEGMKKVSETDALTLYVNEEDAGFAVKDNASGKMWFSCPQNTDEDPIASNYYQRVLKSQLQVKYYNEDVQVSVMDSYNDAVSGDQFTISPLEDGSGFEVLYTIGNAGNDLLLPESISEERFALFTSQMEEKALKKINRNYVLEEGESGNYYRLREGVKDYIREELAGYFEGAGYTSEDYELDAQMDTSDSGSDKPWFKIPVEYRLEEDSFIASIDPDEVEYNDDGYYLVSIDLLPYFGAAGSDAEGYMFVPDGSGALINLNNGKTSVSGYSARVYGQDLSQQVLGVKESETDDDYSIKLPVFGIKADDQAFYAIIENGDGYSTISANVSGKTTSYNNVYCSFDYLAYGEASLSDVVGSNSYQLYGIRDFSDTYQIRYKFLTGDDADYSQMANGYRDYLTEKGELSFDGESAGSSDLPFFAEIIGAIDKYKTMMGIRYRSVETLTSYDEAKEISDQLLQNGISNQTMVYTGWMNGGLHSSANINVNPIRKLNGKLNIKSFLTSMAEENVDVYMGIELQNVYQNKLTDGYSTMAQAPGYFDHTTITQKDYSLSSGVATGKKSDLISPNFVVSNSQKLLKGLGKYGVSGVDIGSASNRLYSDYLEERYADREKAISLYESSFNLFSQSGLKVLSDDANEYALKYSAKMVNVPLYSNNYRILDANIPFYEMVIHGSIEYAGEALNMADDYETDYLKCAEYGAGLHYLWIYRDNSLLKETDYDDLYSINYETWIDKAIADYERLNSVMSGLGNQKIISHEYIEDDLAKVTYENGVSIYVNYSNQTKNADGLTIDARSIARK